MKEIYYIIVLIGLALALVMPQHGKERIRYIVLIAIIHAFICAFRYKYLTGDLVKYNTEFQDVHWFSYFSQRVLRDGKNTGFYWLMKFMCDLTGGYFPSLLIFVAVVVEIATAVLIYRYSPRPWLSFLIWDCMGFYISGFSAVKQSLAMALVMFAMIGILEEKPKKFLLFALLAGFVHTPAFAFLPAYWIAKNKIKFSTVVLYVSAAAIIFTFRNQIVVLITSFYYEEDEFQFAADAALGGRFFMMALILLCGIFIKGFADTRFEKLFNMLVVGAIFQMFSGFDNIFTRFADYYFQFSVLYFPMMFSNEDTDNRLKTTNRGALFAFNERSLGLMSVMLAVVLIWYYHVTCLGRPIDYSTWDYLNYQFDWQVK